MKNLVKLLSFILYVSIIFFVENNILLLLIVLINVVITINSAIKIKVINKDMKTFLPIVLFTFVINSLTINIKLGIKISLKLLLICNTTCIFSKNMRYIELADAIEKLFYPIKLINMNPKDVSLVVCIALNFIPILKDEIYQMKNALKSKGYKINLKNSRLLYKMFFNALIRRINDIENALKAKAYQE